MSGTEEKPSTGMPTAPPAGEKNAETPSQLEAKSKAPTAPLKLPAETKPAEALPSHKAATAPLKPPAEVQAAEAPSEAQPKPPTAPLTPPAEPPKIEVVASVEAADVAKVPPVEKPVSRIAIIIDDEPANRDFLERLVSQADFQTYGAATGEEGKRVVEALPVSPLIIAIDSELPDMKGIELVKHFRPLHPKSKIIMATMLDDRTLINEAFAQGCDVFLVKPHGFMELFKRLRMLEQDPTILDRLVFDHNGVRPRK